MSRELGTAVTVRVSWMPQVFRLDLDALSRRGTTGSDCLGLRLGGGRGIVFPVVSEDTSR